MKFELKLFEPEELRKKTLMASFYLAIAEDLKLNICNDVYDFFSDSWDLQGEEIIRKGYLEKLPECSNKQRRHFGKKLASCLYVLVEMEIISDDELEMLRECYKFRNDIAHNMLEYMVDINKFKVIKSKLDILYNIFQKITVEWFWQIENPTSADPIPEDNKSEWIGTNNHVTLQFIYKILFVDEDFYYDAEKFIKEMGYGAEKYN